MLAGLGLLLAGCGPQRTTTTALLPGPVWKPRDFPPLEPPAPAPAPPAGPDGLMARAQWAGDTPLVSLMNRMLPVRFITVHHDGMEPFFASDVPSTAARLEFIRRAHRNKGWGDIGYHFAVDRDGRVWEARPLPWQGAHVKDHNEGNLGVVALGNFDRQTPAAAQVLSLNRLVSQFMRQYGVPLERVKTHKEWEGAATACPGVNLQRIAMSARRSRQWG